jgi:hypothetical protein
MNDKLNPEEMIFEEMINSWLILKDLNLTEEEKLKIGKSEESISIYNIILKGAFSNFHRLFRIVLDTRGDVIKVFNKGFFDKIKKDKGIKDFKTFLNNLSLHLNESAIKSKEIRNTNFDDINKYSYIDNLDNFMDHFLNEYVEFFPTIVHCQDDKNLDFNKIIYSRYHNKYYLKKFMLSNI